MIILEQLDPSSGLRGMAAIQRQDLKTIFFNTQTVNDIAVPNTWRGERKTRKNNCVIVQVVTWPLATECGPKNMLRLDYTVAQCH